MKKESKDLIKIILLGETFTGKTCLINLYDKNIYNDKNEVTQTASFISKEVNTTKGNCYVKIWDTAGQEKFRCINKIFIKDTNIIIYVYDITRKTTFEALKFWVNYAEKCIKRDEVVYGIVGNKIDLYDKKEQIKENDPKMEFELVNKNDAEEYAKSIQASFIETSAKENAPGFSEFILGLIEEFQKKNKRIEKRNSFSLNNNIKNKKRNKKCCS